MSKQPPKISFCTTCMGRLEHLKQTLPKNIHDNADYPDCQFVVVNYGGEKDTEQWIRNTFQAEIASGKLKYVSYPEAKHFRFAHAKNIAHRMADGDIVCNMDADQYTGMGFARLIAKTFRHNRSIYMRHSPVAVANGGNVHASSLGKIVLRKKDFEWLRGYNEQLEGWGGEDTDLNARMLLCGMHNVAIPLEFAHGIGHSNEMRTSMLHPYAQQVSKAHLHQTGSEKTGFARLAGKAGRVAKLMVRAAMGGEVNPDGYGAGEVYVNFSDTPARLADTTPAAVSFHWK